MEKNNVIKLLDKVMHPAINYSLIKLGILTNIEITGNEVSAIFAFPFPNIPIADQLIHSISKPLEEVEMKFTYQIRLMTDTEKKQFLQLENEAWSGL